MAESLFLGWILIVISEITTSFEVIPDNPQQGGRFSSPREEKRPPCLQDIPLEESQPHSGNLCQQDQGNAQHKFELFGFMPYQQHS